MSKRDPKLLLDDILDSASKIRLYTSGQTFEEFLADTRTTDAVIRNFEIIGEAAGRLPSLFKKQHASVDWKRIRGFRNRIVHDYFGIDHEIVWTIIQTYLPVMVGEVERIRDEARREADDAGG